ncbi:GNAT family N-acetyltransferase [Bacillus suaedae]|uniref:GNAT family N-acetyltransferase n=1 Tax=Halalkalibacter suaedae TaxID=2822140 RepID=A0A941APE7_9BACI|nr:GNAT family N-acetyltransferase [Bacillus suaedae]MBP3952705.1 GNAT family N-acetyltransferase [Bacillus suaedae]
MIIRVATEEDLTYINSFATIVQNEATGGYLKGIDGSKLNGPGIKEYWVLEETNQVCGWILVGESRAPFTGEATAMIFELYVLPQFRGNGYATFLMNAAINHFKIRGYTKAHLNVFAQNPAKRIYDKLGFYDVATVMEKIL